MVILASIIHTLSVPIAHMRHMNYANVSDWGEGESTSCTERVHIGGRSQRESWNSHVHGNVRTIKGMRCRLQELY